MTCKKFCILTIMLLVLEFVVGIIFIEWCLVSIYRCIFRKQHIPFRSYCDKRLPNFE